MKDDATLLRLYSREGSNEAFTAVVSRHVDLEQRQAQQTAKQHMERARELGKKVAGAVPRAIEAYRSANGGAAPPNNEALIPYFVTLQDGANFVEYLEAEKAARGK